MNVTDVMSKIKVVEQSLGAFIKQNNEQFKAITEVICKSSSSGTTSDVVLLETPSKRRKVSQAPGSVEGVTPLGQNHGVSFRDIATKTNNSSRASHQQQQFPSLSVQGLQFTNQSHLQPTNNTVSNTNNRNKRIILLLFLVMVLQPPIMTMYFPLMLISSHQESQNKQLKRISRTERNTRYRY